MAVVHDYICDVCGNILLDQWGAPDATCCDKDMRIHFGNFGKGIFKDDLVRDQTHGADGGIARASVRNDPLALAEIGLGKRGMPNGTTTFTRDQKVEFLGKYLRDGDSPKLRREILSQRAQNQGKVYNHQGRA
jgi:hypothetical protein